MLGLSLQALLDYINSDNINGLRSFLLNKHIQVRLFVVQLYSVEVRLFVVQLLCTGKVVCSAAILCTGKVVCRAGTLYW